MTALPAQIEVISEPEKANSVLNPLRLRLLESLRAPNSASGLARDLDLPRQKVNYHVRELEEDGLVRLVEERRKGNCTERIVQATSTYYLISPEVLGALGDRPEVSPDRFSSTYLVAVAAQLVRDVAVLRRRAERAGKPLATLTVAADVRFRSAQERGAFAEELTQTVARLCSKYHDEAAPGGRAYRFVLGAHPVITKTDAQEAKCD